MVDGLGGRLWSQINKKFNLIKEKGILYYKEISKRFSNYQNTSSNIILKP